MVTLQILVLPFLVRVRVSQQKELTESKLFFVFLYLNMLCESYCQASHNDAYHRHQLNKNVQ